MYLNLKTRRPHLLLSILLGVIACVLAWAMSVPVAAVGGDDSAAVVASPRDVRTLEQRLSDLRRGQTVSIRREEILRAQLESVEHAMDRGEADYDELRLVREDLLDLLLDRRRAEDEIASSIRELWDAQGYAQRAARRTTSRTEHVVFDWPVAPALGVSATFDDAGYRARFGFAHNAIDIPVNQGSIVHAVADGVVEKISDQGLGFSSIVIRHGDGYASMYGHVSAFLVAEGDPVSMGDPIAESGGMPGTKGAGRITTGPHLHLEILQDGAHVDPLPLLPER